MPIAMWISPIRCNSHDLTLHATLSDRAASVRPVARVLGATKRRGIIHLTPGLFA